MKPHKFHQPAISRNVWVIRTIDRDREMEQLAEDLVRTVVWGGWRWCGVEVEVWMCVCEWVGCTWMRLCVWVWVGVGVKRRS